LPYASCQLQTADGHQQIACKCFVDEYYNWQDPQNAMCQKLEASSQQLEASCHLQKTNNKVIATINE
jgi:hypothetical protein